MLGYTDNMKQILLSAPESELPLGSLVAAEILGAGEFKLQGRIL